MGITEKDFAFFKLVEEAMHRIYKNSASTYSDQLKREIKIATSRGTWQLRYVPKE